MRMSSAAQLQGYVWHVQTLWFEYICTTELRLCLPGYEFQRECLGDPQHDRRSLALILIQPSPRRGGGSRARLQSPRVQLRVEF